MTERFTPEMSVRYSLNRRGISIEDLGVAPTVVVCWGRKAVEFFAGDISARPSEHWTYKARNPLYVGQIDGRPVSIAHLPVGAPGTIMVMEEMIVCGARTFFGLGWAGSLQPTAPVGHILLPTSCLSEEGTSLHYVTPGTPLAPDPALVDRLETAAEREGCVTHRGSQWTTDAPYRELVSTIEGYAARGVLGVDMETSAMYALGRFRGVSVANLLVVSDELWQAWNPAFGTEELQQATARAWRVVKRAIAAG
ncbi:MAG: nucleoside phosphorylase [Chloroflexota bacterium]|nr:nucleoside phosphorylase [Chloroflexota bacterium]